MAYTEIHSITKTPQSAIDYIRSDKKDKDGNTTKTVSSYQNCCADSPKKDFDILRLKAEGGKRRAKPQTKSGDEVVMWHLIQTFEESPKDMTVELAQLIGKSVATELFGNFACIVSTHTNTDHIHNHIMIGAWGIDGKKYNDCHKTKRQIREVSDRLCKEYGLSVIEHTKDMNLIKWRDDEGQIHFYEKTPRKDAVREGKFSNANDYRDTEAYEISIAQKNTNRNTIRRDIDNLLPSVNSYEDLLDKLRQIGYLIKDKKKNGEWREHITFIAPMKEKGTRDYKITDDGYYTRESLTSIIEKQLAERIGLKDDLHIEEQPTVDALPIQDHYEYSKTDIEKLDRNYRKIVHGDGEVGTVRRSEIESIVISDLKRMYAEIESRFDTSESIQLPSVGVKSYRPRTTKLTEERKNYIVDCINEDFRALSFIENRNISSFVQINGMVKALTEDRVSKTEELKQYETKLDMMKNRFSLIDKLAELQARVNAGQDDVHYSMYELSADKNLIYTYETLIAQYGLDDPAAVEKVSQYINNFDKKCVAARELLKMFSDKLEEYSECVETLRRIDNDNGGLYKNSLRMFDDIVHAEDNDKPKEQPRTNSNERDSR